MTTENFDNITILINNFTDNQLVILRGLIDEEQRNRDEKKIEQYYNKIADLFDEIKKSGFEIYYGCSNNINILEAGDLTIEKE